MVKRKTKSVGSESDGHSNVDNKVPLSKEDTSYSAKLPTIHGGLSENPCLSNVDQPEAESSNTPRVTPTCGKHFDETPTSVLLDPHLTSPDDDDSSEEHHIGRSVGVDHCDSYYYVDWYDEVDYCDPHITNPYDNDLYKEYHNSRSVDVDHCDSDCNVLWYHDVSSSENETVPSDEDDEEEISSLKPRKLNFEDECQPNKSDVCVKDKDADVELVKMNIMEYMEQYPRTKASTIRKKFYYEWRILISYQAARHARHRCHEIMHGPYEESYRLLPQLCQAIKANNPGSIVTWSSEPGSKEFQGLCIAYKASLDGFNDGCRPIIALKGSPLQSKYGGAVLSATSLDANNGMFPVAIYICRRECFLTWKTFLEIIAPSLEEFGRKITFFSGFRKGCDTAVNLTFKDPTQRICSRQMEKELQRQYFYSYKYEYEAREASQAYNYQQYEAALVALEAIGPLAVRWMKIYGKQRWARHKFDSSASCRHTTNIVSVAFDQWIKELRCLPICQWVMRYERQIFDLFEKRYCFGQFNCTWKQETRKQENLVLVPRVMSTLEKQRSKINGYVVSPTPNKVVWFVKNQNLEWTWEVNLTQRLCTCGEWQIAGVPCVHAIAVIVKEIPQQVESYVHECFTVTRYNATYAGSIKPTTSIHERRQESEIFLNPPPLKIARKKGSYITKALVPQKDGEKMDVEDGSAADVSTKKREKKISKGEAMGEDKPSTTTNGGAPEQPTPEKKKKKKEKRKLVEEQEQAPEMEENTSGKKIKKKNKNVDHTQTASEVKKKKRKSRKARKMSESS